MGNKCESCGMPLEKDPNKGGTEQDGSLSQTYCSLCYDNGKFIHDGITATQMQDICITALKAKGMPGIIAWLFTRGIPKLGRWKT